MEESWHDRLVPWPQRTNNPTVEQFQMGIISFRFKHWFVYFAVANHLLNKQLLYLCTVPHFAFKLCVCFAPRSLLWSIINNFAESSAVYWRGPACYLRSTWNRRFFVFFTNLANRRHLPSLLRIVCSRSSEVYRQNTERKNSKPDKISVCCLWI